MKKACFFLWLYLFIFSTTDTYAGIPWLISLLISPTHQNCLQSLATKKSGFCASFKATAECHCTSSGLPTVLCQDMNILYQRMEKIFGSQKEACEYQKDTTTQICMDDWNCYRLGGKDSHGNKCNATGKHC